MLVPAGPTTLEDPKDIEVIHVQSAEEMFEQVTSRFDEQDIVVKAAAVSDDTPVDVLEHKMKSRMAIFVSIFLNVLKTFLNI